MTALAAALLAQLDDDALAELAVRLAPFMPRPEPADQDAWLTTREAAKYLGVTPNALHKLTAARAIPFEQDAPGAKCWFRKAELDAWRRGTIDRSGIMRPARSKPAAAVGRHGGL